MQNRYNDHQREETPAEKVVVSILFIVCMLAILFI
jgi:hypothetical protein